MLNVTIIRRSVRTLSCMAAASVLLAACGGGGSSDAAATLAGETAVQTSGVATTQDTAASTTTAAAVETSGSSTSQDASASNAATPVAASTETSSSNNGAQASAAAAEAKTPYGQDASKYDLSFSEEFENGFDTKVWNDKIWYETGNATKNYTVENGALKIWPQRDASGNFFNRTIDTDGKYYQTYGYFEVEAKLSKGKGTWPAFWLFNHIGDRRPEIDVMEAYSGGGPNSGWSDANLHPTAYAPTVWRTLGDMAGTKVHQAGVDLSAGFHKYAVKWEPNKQTFYFDGKEVYSLNVSMGDPMYIMLDLWYGSASGQPDNSTPTGKDNNSYEVNYVRAWKFK